MKTKIILFSLSILSIGIILFFSPVCFGQSDSGSISGTITDVNGHALGNANIIIVGITLGTVSDTNGNFRIDNLKPGKFTLKIMCMGYQSEIRNAIPVEADQTYHLNIKLIEKVLPMQEIVVTPGNFSIAQSQSVRQQVIEKERITAIPATLDDIYRVLQLIPGVSFSDDFSAHFHVRGGKQNENSILLDGIEIFDPYHLKDVGGAIGIMNIELIDDVGILTGGFPAKYGDYLSSIFLLKNRNGMIYKF